MALNMDTVFSKLGEATTKVEDDIGKFTGTMDASNTEDVMKLQQMMQKWSISTQMQTNTLKTIGDGIKSIVQNMR